MTSVEDTMKNISQVILLSTSCLIWYGADNVCASVNVFSGIPKSGTNTHDTHYLADDCPHLPSAQSNNKQRHPRRSAATSGVPGENIESLFNLDVRSHSQSDAEHDIRVASVCFITDTGECSGRGGGENPVDPVNPIPPQPSPSEACEEAGYELTSCPSLAHGENFCPIDSSYFKICVCDDNLKECHKPYYGIGPSCDGKYASCEKDTPRACKEDGYGQSGACPDLQTPNRKCPYDNAYYDKCVCRSDLVTCTYPQTGVGEVCGGKYASCQCPSSYKSCECGGAAGATSCTVNGQTTYSSCKDCCGSEYVYDSSNCPAPKKLGGKACGGKYTACEGQCSDAGYLDKIPSGKICNKITYSGKTCYTSCRENDIPNIAKQYCSDSDLSYEEYRNNGEYLGVIVGNVIVSNEVPYNSQSSCYSDCAQSSRGGIKWRIPARRDIEALRCAIAAMGGKTYDVYWNSEIWSSTAGGAWLFGEDRSGPSWMYSDNDNYCTCISDL